MAGTVRKKSIVVMRYPKVSEQHVRLWAVEHDPFIDNLPDRPAQAPAPRTVKPVHAEGRVRRLGQEPRRSGS